MRTRHHPIGLALALVVLGLLVAGCAGSTGSTLSGVGQPVGGDRANGSVGQAAPSAATAGEGTGSNPYGSNGGNGNNAAPLRDDAKIVRTGTLELRVDAIDAAVARATAAMDRLGAYVGASRVANDGDRSVAQITYRIPTDRWDEALAALRGVASEVIAEQTDALEVTGQLVDLEARIANLRASEVALQGIAEKATQIKDVLEVQARLTDVRGQIEQLGAQKARLDDQVSYGTLAVTFGRQVVAVTEAAKGWNAADEVDRASATLVDVLQALASAGIWVAIVWLPVLLMIGIVAIAVAYMLRRLGILRREEPPPAGPEPASA